VASGSNFDHRFPNGTLAMQIPIFQKMGLDLSAFFQGTVNVDISPKNFLLKQPLFRFNDVKWSQDLRAENFSFFPCKIRTTDQLKDGVEFLVYWPHPSTKPEFHQAENTLELIGPHLASVAYGTDLIISANPHHILFVNQPK